jgi:hypothetical protein
MQADLLHLPPTHRDAVHVVGTFGSEVLISSFNEDTSRPSVGKCPNEDSHFPGKTKWLSHLTDLDWLEQDDEVVHTVDEEGVAVSDFMTVHWWCIGRVDQHCEKDDHDVLLGRFDIGRTLLSSGVH